MRERWVSVRGLRLCVCEWGAPEAPLLVILHGWLDQAASWRRTAAALADAGWRVLALEHRGHGRSDHAPAGSSYHFTEYIVDAVAVLRAEAEQPVVLVGHSMGGTIAAQVAALQPEAVRSLVLVDGLGPPRVSDADAVAQLRTHIAHQLRDPKPPSSFETVEEAAARLLRANPALPDGEARFLAARATVEVDGGPQLRWRWDPMHRSRAAVAFDLDRFLLVLGQIQCPAALILGETSWYRALPDLDARTGRIPGFRETVMLPTGHSPHMEAPGVLAASLLRLVGAARTG